MERITKGHPLSQSHDLVKENIEKLKELFPTIVKENQIDWDELKVILGEEIVSGEEYYKFTWAGKSQAKIEANKRSTGTLRPIKEGSKNWENTQNIFIEGDNLEVLKLLQKSYAGKIKMMYFDPPYNTGNEFIYQDDYSDNLSNYLIKTKQINKEGSKFRVNAESEGRFHSNWLNMIYPRLKLARNLLKDDGVIFISIDDNESTNLRKVCDEVFGEGNFISDITVVNNLKGRNDKRYIATANERLLMYVKTPLFDECGLRLPTERIDEFNLKDEIGNYRELGLRKRGGADTRELRPNMYYPIYVNPQNGTVGTKKSELLNIEVLPKKSNGKDGCWRWGIETTKLRLKSLVGRAVGNNGKWDVFEKDYIETDGEIRRIKPKSVFSGTNYSTDRATKEYRALMLDVDFSSPKPVSMLSDLIEYSVLKDKNDIILDIFAGSCTTAHGLFEINATDGGNRRFIMVQLPEPIPDDSPGFDLGLKSIADIGKERIRRSGDKILEDKKVKLENLRKSIEGKILQEETEAEIKKLENIIKNLDIGFRTFNLDTSNILTWDGSIENIEENLLSAVENIKPDRTEDDVLFEILIKYGIDLAQPVDEKTIAGFNVFSIGAGVLFVCLSDKITTTVADGIGKWKNELQPEVSRVVFKDSGFAGDVDKTNTIQILKRYGITDVRSI